MRRHIITGAMGTIYGTLTTGTFLVAFGEIIGVSIVQWGILTGVCSFAISLQLVSAYWASRVGYRRALWFVLETASRLVRAIGLAAGFLLFVRGYHAAAATWMIVLLCAGGCFTAAGQPAWFSWLADIIPERVHGRFMGRRDAWISLATIGVTIPLSYWLDLVSQDQKFHVLAVMFGVGILLGVVDLFLHRQIPEPPAARQLENPFWHQVLTPLKDREYRYWLVFTVVWNFAMFLGGALATVYFLNNLGLRRNFLGASIALVAVPFVGPLFTSRWSGRVVDRLGVRRVLIASHFVWCILPILWVVAVPRTALFWLGLSSLLGGAATSAAVNSSNKLILRIPPPQKRAMYMAVTACLNNLSGGAASILAGYFLAGLGDRHCFFAGKDFVPFDLLFVISFVLRIASWLMLFGLKPPKFDQGKL